MPIIDFKNTALPDFEASNDLFKASQEQSMDAYDRFMKGYEDFKKNRTDSNTAEAQRAFDRLKLGQLQDPKVVNGIIAQQMQKSGGLFDETAASAYANNRIGGLQQRALDNNALTVSNIGTRDATDKYTGQRLGDLNIYYGDRVNDAEQRGDLEGALYWQTAKNNAMNQFRSNNDITPTILKYAKQIEENSKLHEQEQQTKLTNATKVNRDFTTSTGIGFAIGLNSLPEGEQEAAINYLHEYMRKNNYTPEERVALYKAIKDEDTRARLEASNVESHRLANELTKSNINQTDARTAIALTENTNKQNEQLKASTNGIASMDQNGAFSFSVPAMQAAVSDIGLAAKNNYTKKPDDIAHILSAEGIAERFGGKVALNENKIRTMERFVTGYRKNGKPLSITEQYYLYDYLLTNRMGYDELWNVGSTDAANKMIAEALVASNANLLAAQQTEIRDGMQGILNNLAKQTGMPEKVILAQLTNGGKNKLNVDIPIDRIPEAWQDFVQGKGFSPNLMKPSTPKPTSMDTPPDRTTPISVGDIMGTGKPAPHRGFSGMSFR